jgi:hypothetical protein
LNGVKVIQEMAKHELLKVKRYQAKHDCRGKKIHPKSHNTSSSQTRTNMPRNTAVINFCEYQSQYIELSLSSGRKGSEWEEESDS